MSIDPSGKKQGLATGERCAPTGTLALSSVTPSSVTESASAFARRDDPEALSLRAHHPSIDPEPVRAQWLRKRPLREHPRVAVDAGDPQPQVRQQVEHEPPVARAGDRR
jgi:hypothetical protein